MGIQPVLYKEVTALDSVPIAVAAYSLVGFFTIATPILLHLITKKYVTTMEYNKINDVYSAVTYNFFCVPREVSGAYHWCNTNIIVFFFLLKLHFKIKDVKVPDVPGLFTSIIVKGKPLFLDPNQFSDISHYSKMMGFDKPVDFKLYQNGIDDKK